MLLTGFNVFYLRGWGGGKCDNNAKHHVRLTLQWKHMHGVCGNHGKIVRKERPHTLTSSHTLFFFINIVIYLWLKSQSENQDKISVFDMLLCRFIFSSSVTHIDSMWWLV